MPEAPPAAAVCVPGAHHPAAAGRRTRAAAVEEAERGIESDIADQLQGGGEIPLGLAGKPTMKSEEMLMSGRTARSLRMRSLNSSAV